MDNATFDRMKAFLLGNPSKPDEDLSQHSPLAPALQMLAFNIPSERNRNSDPILAENIQSGGGDTGRLSFHSKQTNDAALSSARSFKSDLKPTNLPNYVYQYGKSMPFLNKIPQISSTSDLQKPMSSHRDFSPYDKENNGALSVLYELSSHENITPVKKRIIRLNSGSDVKKGFYSPAVTGKPVSSPQTNSMFSKKNTISYVDEQKKFYQKLRSQARKEILRPASRSRVSPTSRSLKSLTPRIDTASMTNLFSAQSRGFLLERRSAGNSRKGSIDLNQNVMPSSSKAYSTSKKQIIDALLRKDETFQRHQAQKSVQQIMQPLQQIQIQKPRPKPREDVVFEYEEAPEKFQSDISPIRPAKVPESGNNFKAKKEAHFSRPKNMDSVQSNKVTTRKEQSNSRSVKKIVSPRGQNSQRSNVEHDAYKREINQLIRTIKDEKDEITSELEKMAKQLKKYKSAYKKLKKEAQSKGQQTEERSPEPEEDRKLTQTEEEYPLLIENLEKQEVQSTPKPGKGINHSMKFSSSPATITHQFGESSSRTPRKSAMATSNDLIEKVCDLNKDVENILNGEKPETILPSEGLLAFAPVVNYVLKTLKLDSKMFYPEGLKAVELETKPKSRLIVKAQNEMILHLVKRLQSEQSERLKTEEQTHQVLHSMEKTLKKLEDTKFMTRKREPTTPTCDTNVSIASSNNFN